MRLAFTRLSSSAAITLTLALGFAANSTAGVITADALVKPAFKLENKVTDRRSIDDYHITIIHQGPGNLDLRGGKYEQSFNNFVDIPPANVSGSGTPTVKVDLDRAVAFGGFFRMSLDFIDRVNAIRVTESYWTIKDINGKPVRVPKNQGGDVPVPGYEVQGDPLYTIFNDFDVAMGIRGLQFALNVPEIPSDSVDPGMMPGFGIPLPDFVLPALSSMQFDVHGSLSPGNFFYAQGTVFDAGFTLELSSFLHGHQSPVPGPSTFLLLATGCVGLLGYGWRRRKQAA